MRLSELIRQYRLEHGLSQRQFAAKCDGITNGYISMLENEANPHTGKPSIPSLEKLSAIARGMGLTLSELVTRADDLDINIPASAPPPVFIPHRDTRPYSPARSMVAVVGSVRCGPGGALAYTDLQGAEMADVNDPSEYFYLRAVYVSPDHLDITFSFEDGTDRPPARVELEDGVCIGSPGGHQIQLIQTLARVGRVFVMSVSRPR